MELGLRLSEPKVVLYSRSVLAHTWKFPTIRCATMRVLNKCQTSLLQDFPQNMISGEVESSRSCRDDIFI